MRNEYKPINSPAFWFGDAPALLKEINDSMLLDPYIGSRDLIILQSAPDVGKSTFVKQLAIAIASNDKSFCGFNLDVKHGRVMIVSTEEDAHDVTSKLSWIVTKIGRNAQDLKYDIAVLPTCSDLKDEVSKKTIDSFKELKLIIDNNLKFADYDLIIVDALHDIFALAGAKSMNNDEARALLSDFYVIAKSRNVTIIFVHHINKGSYKSGPDQVNSQGAGSIAGKARCVLELSKLNNDTNRYLFCVKGNRITEFYKSNGVVLDFSDGIFSDTGNKISKDDFNNMIAGSMAKEDDKKTKEEDKKAKEEPHLDASFWKDVFLDAPVMKEYHIAKKLGINGYKASKLAKEAVYYGYLTKIGTTEYGLPEPVLQSEAF